MSAPTAPEQCDPAWAPLLGAAYALLVVASVLFLAAGFPVVESLVESLGSVAPAADRLAPFVGLAMIGILGMIVAVPFARGQLERMPEASVGPRLLAVAVTSLVLMAPPVQWVMFGRPDPMAAHHHDMADMKGAAESCEHDAPDAAAVALHAHPGEEEDAGHDECAESAEHEEDGHDHADH